MAPAHICRALLFLCRLPGRVALLLVLWRWNSFFTLLLTFAFDTLFVSQIKMLAFYTTALSVLGLSIRLWRLRVTVAAKSLVILVPELVLPHGLDGVVVVADRFLLQSLPLLALVLHLAALQ